MKIEIQVRSVMASW